MSVQHFKTHFQRFISVSQNKLVMAAVLAGLVAPFVVLAPSVSHALTEAEKQQRYEAAQEMMKKERERRQNASREARICSVCLYEHVNYKGKRICADNFSPNSKKVSSLRKKKLSNKVSSVQITGGGCAAAEAKVTLYEDPNYRSYELTLAKSEPRLSKFQLRRKKGLFKRNDWNDVADSFIFYTSR